MKHSVPVLLVFISLFLLAQVSGLYLVGKSIDEIQKTEAGEVNIVFTNTSLGERPEMTGAGSLLYIVIGVLIGTVILLFFVKLKKFNWWRAWFLLAAWLTMSIALGVFLSEDYFWIAWIIAAILAVAKIYWPNPIIHNLTEVLMYAGLAVMLVPILEVWVMLLLLVLVSIYDMYAVWRSKHMIKMAEFTKSANLFPGFTLAYRKHSKGTKFLSFGKRNNLRGAENNQSAKQFQGRETREDSSNFGSEEFGEKQKTYSGREQSKSAAVKVTASASKKAPEPAASFNRIGVLGGGDVVFPLLFAGAIMLSLIEKGHTFFSALCISVIVSVCAAVALLLLFIFGRKDRFYPAMPFISAGCILGYGLVLLLF